MVGRRRSWVAHEEVVFHLEVKEIRPLTGGHPFFNGRQL